MVQLRDYQEELLARVEQPLTGPSARVMMQLPTGGGKTRIAGELLLRWLKGGRKAVWLTHRRELAGQTERMLQESGVPATYNMGWTPNTDAPTIANGVVIFMAQTVSRRTNLGNVWNAYNSSDLMIIDEAHHATADGWQRAINQWSGPVLGMTATPWRLSKVEGFDRLFHELECGLQVADLQSKGWLCQARMLMPGPEDIIRGGGVSSTGDYNENGIWQANNQDVMTARALRFWQTHAAGCQTIIYAISQDHAKNLAVLFKDSGIPAAVMLSDTPPEERAKTVESFANGTLQVLVNVAVATEGFDLPDASCVVLTRPTLSLSLYLQMVGRGLRPKSDGGDCLILDLAGNAEVHGLSEDDREWSLYPRGNGYNGKGPAVWCQKCSGVSPAASHFCQHCDASLGRNCGRCGKWRATKRWALAEECPNQHEVVCDLCHLDAHVEAKLPESRELREAAIDPVLFALVHEVQQHLLGENNRRDTLEKLIAERQREKSDDAILDSLFDEYVASIPDGEQPSVRRGIGILFISWECQRREELDRWNEELVGWKSEAAIEDKVRRGCLEQLEQAENYRNKPEEPSADEASEKSEENKFLSKILSDEIAERVHFKSRLDEIDLKVDGTEDYRQLMQLAREYTDARDHRLRAIRQQLDKRWPEIWAEQRKS